LLGFLVSWRLAEIPVLLLCGAALERGISQLPAGSGYGTTTHRDAALWLRTALAAAVFNP
jgi:hypothetical protein